MTTRYQKRHYEDVARILSYHMTTAGMDDEQERMQWLTWIAKSFVDLFAADNPRGCWRTLHDKPCYVPFNRADFLTACGLESEE